MSSKPSKQRKNLWGAPQHRRHKLMSSALSFELSTRYGRRSFPVRKGDTVQVCRGDYAGTEGKVSRVDMKKHRVYVEGVTREKADGSQSPIPVHPSKVRITKLNTDDKWRMHRLSQKLSEEAASIEEKSGA